MLNILVETKNEYTTHLINILTPLVFEGLQSIYKESLEVAKSNDVLKIFQSFLKAIPKWNQLVIDKETNRIINSSQSYGWINDLIRATLKANLIVLMYNPTSKVQVKIDPKLYQNIKTSDFIHRVYIECARELWNNPYLLYHNYPPIEIKRNQRDCMNIIKDCIKEALRKLLPVKHILQIYLGEDMEVENQGDQFEKALTDVEERNLTKIIQKDLAGDKTANHDLSDSEDTVKPNSPNDTPVNPSNLDDKLMVVNQDNIPKSNTEEKTIGSKILNIINHNSDTSDDIASILSSNSTSDKSDKSNKSNNDTDSLASLARSIKQFEQVLNPESKLNKAESFDDKVESFDDKVESFDDKIKKVLQKDLATDSDLETSLNYSQEDNDNKYQEIFSNSIVSAKNPSKDDSRNLKDKKKFFNNYLAF